MEADLKSFSKALATLALNESDTAVALLWFLSRENEEIESSAADLGGLMHSLSLRGKINATRLAERLAHHRDTVRGNKSNTFKIKLSSRQHLDEEYGEFVSPPKPTIQSHIIPAEDFISTRRYLEALALQINGAYQFGFYDSCAVLCRRLMETLLISSFQKASKAAAIMKDGEYLPLSDIIGAANSKKYIRLTRAASKVMDQVKKVGDAAAHHPTYITRQTDIDDIKIDFRRLIGELMALSAIEPTSAS